MCIALAVAERECLRCNITFCMAVYRNPENAFSCIFSRLEKRMIPVAKIEREVQGEETSTIRDVTSTEGN
jgi:hypothetical protein